MLIPVLHKRNFITPFFLLSIFLVSSCSKKDASLSDPYDPSQAKVLKNESYGSNALQKADVYLPANRGSSTKTMVLIHGGFWTSGDKSDLDTLIDEIQLADPALAIINMNYRLADGNASNYYPAQLNDVSLLLDYLQSKQSLWHTGPDYALTGISSGGHIALQYAYAFDPAKRVKVVASILGPTNLADKYYTMNPIFQDLTLNVFGKSWQQDSSIYINASPINKVTSAAPPTFMAYGGSDILIPVSNPDSLDKKLQQLNIPHEYNLYPTEGHDLSRNAILDIISKMALFFKAHL